MSSELNWLLPDTNNYYQPASTPCKSSQLLLPTESPCDHLQSLGRHYNTTTLPPGLHISGLAETFGHYLSEKYPPVEVVLLCSAGGTGGANNTNNSLSHWAPLCLSPLLLSTPDQTFLSLFSSKLCRGGQTIGQVTHRP